MSFQKLEFDLGPAFTDGPFGPDHSLLAHCLTLADPVGWALEFGVGNGETLRLIAGVLPVIGFDSFKGLPEDWRPEFPKGAFAFNVPTDIINATIVPGWFDDTVPNYDWPQPLSLVHFDADLYSSTVAALSALDGSIHSGTILVFDEFFGYEGCEAHEQRAFAEFLAHTTYRYEVIGHGREQWAVRIV